jgi:DNA-binding FadR family transcriptional regulator
MNGRLHPTDVARLHPADVAAIAATVVELLRDEAAAHGERLVDAATLAREFGVSRKFVYSHADELGAVRLGKGRRPRVRFAPERAAEVLSARSVSKASPAQPAPRRRRSRGAPAGYTRAGSPLLPIPAEKA